MTRQQIAAVAAKMIEGQVDVLEGCRTVVRLRWNLSEPDLSDPDLLSLIAVDSELDDVPLERVRKHWKPEPLALKDKKKAQYLQAVKDEILRACRALVMKWSLCV